MDVDEVVAVLRDHVLDSLKCFAVFEVLLPHSGDFCLNGASLHAVHFPSSYRIWQRENIRLAQHDRSSIGHFECDILVPAGVEVHVAVQHYDARSKVKYSFSRVLPQVRFLLVFNALYGAKYVNNLALFSVVP